MRTKKLLQTQQLRTTGRKEGQKWGEKKLFMALWTNI